MLIMQGALDGNMLRSIQENSDHYKAGGGRCDFTRARVPNTSGWPRQGRRRIARRRWPKLSLRRLSLRHRERLSMAEGSRHD
jgi:hypothetical protein